MTYRINQMDQLSALFDVVRRYPGGVPAMASRVPTEGGHPMSTSHLYELLRGAKPLSVERQDLMIHFARQARVDHWAQPLHAKAAEHGCILVEPRQGVHTPDVLSAAMLSVVSEFGDLAREAATDVADGRVSARELESIEREGYEAIAAIAAFVELCREVCANGGR
jgi:hypothetical protein